jgi:subtilisin family serine protease
MRWTGALLALGASLAFATSAWAAAGKIDPRLLVARTAARGSGAGWAPAAGAQPYAQAQPAPIALPVILRTSLGDADLAALGVQVRSRVGEFVTATVAAGDLDGVAAHPEVVSIEGAYRLDPTLDASIPEIRADLVYQADPSYTGSGVIVGIVDTGIDLTHEDFKNDLGGTRILSIWEQDAVSYAPPSGFSYGREYTRAQIDQGQATSHRDLAGHGTHVAGIAAGDGSSLSPPVYRGVAWQSDLIIVRNYGSDIFTYGGVPPWPNGPTTVGTFDALLYLINKARAFGKPLVVNLSQGASMGPHDGSTLFEQAVDDLVRDEGLILCVAAGNDGDHAWHGRVHVTGGVGEFTLLNAASAEPLGSILFECWYQPRDRFTWEIESPLGGLAVMAGDASPAGGLVLGLGALPDSIGYWTTPEHPVNGEGYALFLLSNLSAGLTTGTWTVRARAANGLPAGGVVDLYCERNQEDVRVVQGLNPIGTITMPGSSTEPICVASYNTKLQWQGQDGWHTSAQLGYVENPLGAISTFSSRGPRRDGVLKPDLAAPGMIIASAQSTWYVSNAGFNDPGGKHTYLLGTSMASPHVAGAIALMLEKNPTLTPAQVKSILQQTARRDDSTGPTAGGAFGYGKLDVKAAVDAVEGELECATVPGDADGDEDTDVFDLVAAVNHIIGRTALGPGPKICADVNADRTLNVQDLALIVDLILGIEADGGEGAATSATLAWSETLTETGYRLTLSGAAVAGVQLVFTPPHGYALAGAPRVRGDSEVNSEAHSEANVAHHERLGQHYLVAYAPGGVLAGPAGETVIEVPLAGLPGADAEAGRFDVASLIVSDPNGRRLTLAERPDPEPPAEPLNPPMGVAAFLERIQPNPARGAATIRYTLAATGEVHIDIHDAAGRLVRRLGDGWQMAGDHSLVWDGCDHAGRAAPAGVYFARLGTAGGATQSRRIVLAGD